MIWYDSIEKIAKDDGKNATCCIKLGYADAKY